MTEPQQAYAQYTISTWRYLRLAMVGIVLALATAVVIEVIKAHGHCVKTSISAYYYSPVRALFVAALNWLAKKVTCSTQPASSARQAARCPPQAPRNERKACLCRRSLPSPTCRTEACCGSIASVSRGIR
jgi:hypothetical protein